MPGTASRPSMRKKNLSRKLVWPEPRVQFGFDDDERLLEFDDNVRFASIGTRPGREIAHGGARDWSQFEVSENDSQAVLGIQVSQGPEHVRRQDVFESEVRFSGRRFTAVVAGERSTNLPPEL